MFKTRASSVVALLAAVPAALVTGAANAQSTGAITDITAKVDEAMTGGAAIATAIVIGLFVIWAIKLLWRSK